MEPLYIHERLRTALTLLREARVFVADGEAGATQVIPAKDGVQAHYGRNEVTELLARIDTILKEEG